MGVLQKLKIMMTILTVVDVNIWSIERGWGRQLGMLNPLVTGHLADFFLIKTGILGMINLKFIKNPVINVQFLYWYVANSHRNAFKYDP